MKPKILPQETEIWTRSGKLMNPLNILPEQVSIVDVVHGLAFCPMFGGQTRSYYSLAEHSVNIYDHLVIYFDELIKKFPAKPGGDSKKLINKDDDDDERETTLCLHDISIRRLRLYALLYYCAHPYLTAIIGSFQKPNYHFPRVRAAVLHNIGLFYDEFKVSVPLIKLVDNEVQQCVRESWDSVSDKYLFKSPHQALSEYVSRFNRESDVEIRLHGGTLYIPEPTVLANGQVCMDFNLPTITA